MSNKRIVSRSHVTSVTLAFGVILLTQTLLAYDNQSVRPVEQPVVVDAHGDAVGGVVGLNGPAATVLMDLGGGVFSLNVLPSQLLGTGGPLYFTTSNCTGTAYITFQPPALATPSVLAAPGNSLYAAIPNATPLQITALSQLLPSIPRGAGGKLPLDYASAPSSARAACSSPDIRCPGVAAGGPEHSVHPSVQHSFELRTV
jgi:hypothetical protein